MEDGNTKVILGHLLQKARGNFYGLASRQVRRFAYLSPGPQIALAPPVLKSSPESVLKSAKNAIYGARFPKIGALFGLLPHLVLGAAAQVSLPGEAAAPGSSIILPLTLESDSTTISGVQFDVQYDESAMTLTAVV